MSRKLFLDAVVRKNTTGQAVFGTATSIACRDLMEQTGAWFPEAHLDAEKMAALAITGHTVLGLDGFHWDTKTGSSQKVRRLAGERLSLMGGISNFKLLRETPEGIAADAVEAFRAGIDVIGPECSIPLATPLANLKAVAAVGRSPA